MALGHAQAAEQMTPSKTKEKTCPTVTVCRLLGKVTPSKRWSRNAPKVTVCSPPGNATTPKLSACHTTKTLVEPVAKGPSLQSARNLEAFTKDPCLQDAQQHDNIQALVELKPCKARRMPGKLRSVPARARAQRIPQRSLEVSF